MANERLEQTVEASRKAVAKAARAALIESLGGRAAEIPASLANAIASGAGDRTSLREATRKVFDTERPLELVLFDTDRIADYVFESSRPPVIAGASSLLRDLNDRIAEAHRRFVIFSGGGEGMLLVPAGRGETVCGEIEALYKSRTRGALAVTTGFIAVGPQDFVATDSADKAANGVRVVSGTQAVLARLRDHVRRKKDERVPAEQGVSGKAERCVSCRDREAGARKISDFRDNPRFDGFLCDPCALRWDVGRSEIKGISFEELVEAAGAERAKAKYIGFLYADGNAMGALFGRLSSLAEIRFLSQAVREVFEQLRSRARDVARELAPGKPDAELPFVSYLGGGDEAIWILPGTLALRIAYRLQAWIEEESRAIAGLPEILRRESGLDHLTFGAGLVLCGYTYPVRYQHGLAKELQKSAKSVSYGSGQPVSAIDFEVLTESSPLSESLKSARDLTDATEEPKFRRSCRPYTAERFGGLLARMARLRTVKLATSQLYALQDGVREGRSVFLNFLCYQIARKPAGTKYQAWLKSFTVDPADRAAVEEFFVKKLAGGSGTWIADGLQLAPFLDWED